MTRYREICTELAGRIGAGDLAEGAELPAVRELAHRFGTTASTIGRAVRALADAGVIVTADRRRTRVAPGGAVAARRFLHGERVFRLAGSDDPALDVVLRGLGRAVRSIGTEGSFGGLQAVRQGRADGAAVHLLHHNGRYNAPFARGLLHGLRPHLIHLWRREQGLLVPPGNPRDLASAADLAGLRVAKRRFGTGTRVLLDRLLREAGLDPDALAGPETGSHLETALSVASGVVDTGLAVRSVARDLDLGFVPLVSEEYDVVLPGAALDAAAALVAALLDPATRAAVTALGGYDTSEAGKVEDLDT
ncbi:GntR family transcriptional regulator [Pseudonocardia sp. DSM 110487]|uniref:substrate-binding domain-containing protein n=1 Tax=Pseudonocardia sp. DSM 110487 TaxID=2865833 RepID=UPI001C69AAF4|nr:substrate-binding domain-containing protein [Pseudonocardia sp. DSM 110487]QYN38433.1 GntR family transcriptional regulator [Pseudonocardia sp. DSM 110487]